MKTIAILGVTAVFCAGAVLTGPTAIAQTASEGGVTVVRGNDSNDGAQTRRSSREGGLTVFRGYGGTTPVDPAPKVEIPAAPGYAVAGRNLWFVDPEREKVTGCSLQYNVYGQREMRCASSRY